MAITKFKDSKGNIYTIGGGSSGGGSSDPNDVKLKMKNFEINYAKPFNFTTGTYFGNPELIEYLKDRLNITNLDNKFYCIKLATITEDEMNDFYSLIRLPLVGIQDRTDLYNDWNTFDNAIMGFITDKTETGKGGAMVFVDIDTTTSEMGLYFWHQSFNEAFSCDFKALDIYYIYNPNTENPIPTSTYSLNSTSDLKSKINRLLNRK